jgi:ABC-type antimicrobial peptide transport system permease subunit
MFKNYFKTAWRNAGRNKVHAFINIAGLSMGMAVVMLIALWIWDELSFNKYHRNYDRIAQVMENNVHNNTVHTGAAIALPLDAALRKNYGSDFKHIVMSSWTESHVLTASDKNMSFTGNFMGEDAPDMFSLNMLQGTRKSLTDPSSMLISASVAKGLFGDNDPVNKLIKLDNKATFKVAGVYDDLPVNSTLHDVTFIVPWKFYANAKDWIGRNPDDWSDNSLFMYVQIADNADMAKVSEKIKNIKINNYPAAAKSKPALFLHPMKKWHLYSEFKNGVNTGGAIEYVWLFGIIGVFVLLLACINFMNLSTARSEKRAKEVGIRKSIGSIRSQLIWQFFCESILMAIGAFVFSILLVQPALPFFNNIAGKQISIPWGNPLFWTSGIGFTLVTGLIAGSYPALYLSSFNPVKVLKGTFKAGRYAAIPRQALVVVQFTVSVILITCTIVVIKQIQFAKNRPAGYSREGLIDITATTSDLHEHFDALRSDLLQSGAVAGIAESSSPTYGINNSRGDLEWKEKDPSQTYDFGSIAVTTEYGKTIGWQFAAGRDFDKRLFTDSSAVILNEAAVKYMGLTNPLGELVHFRHKENTVIGVVKDMVMGSPYQAAKPTLFFIGRKGFDDIIIRLSQKMGTHDALGKIEAICRIYSPAVPFSYKFVDEAYAGKFRNEVRISRLAMAFALLAIFISCLGLFGMASFMAEQRVKEIGVRKVLGATVFNLWGLLSKDFVALVIMALVVATPVAWLFMYNWLQNYSYRTNMPWWIFATTGAGAIMITLITVSMQSIKAALANPVKSLRTE